jgi:hypothetical protein
MTLGTLDRRLPQNTGRNASMLHNGGVSAIASCSRIGVLCFRDTYKLGVFLCFLVGLAAANGCSGSKENAPADAPIDAAAAVEEPVLKPTMAAPMDRQVNEAAPDSSSGNGLIAPQRDPAPGRGAGGGTGGSGLAGAGDAPSGKVASGELTPGPNDLADGADPQPEELPTYEATNPIQDAAEKAFAEPKGMKRLSPESNLWVDVKTGQLVTDGYVAMVQGPLEMFACPAGTKEHESVVSILAKAREVHAGLLAIGADSGTPVAFSPEYRPATGQRIAIWVMWRDSDNTIKKVRAQEWVKNLRDDKPLDLDWVFAGSSFWKDPESGREYYQADSGDLVCVSNFTTATLDLPIESSQTNGEQIFVANTANIPTPGTPLRLVFVPIPITGTEAEPDAADPTVPPSDELMVPGV